MDSDEDDTAMNTDPDLDLMSKEWAKMCENRFKDGFIDGSAVGQNEVLQKSFNIGYKQGFLSNFILSKIRGILSALLAYHISYEGHPITEATILETHSLLEEIDSLEANDVAEEFLKLSLNQKPSQNCPPDLVQSFASTSLAPSSGQDAAGASSASVDEDVDTLNLPELDLDAVNGLTIQKVNEILMQCTPILNTVTRCKKILKSLNWTDDMIDSLL